MLQGRQATPRHMHHASLMYLNSIFLGRRRGARHGFSQWFAEVVSETHPSHADGHALIELCVSFSGLARMLLRTIYCRN